MIIILFFQHNLLDYILECLSSEDENVCITSLDLCISSQHNNKSSVMYISDSLIALIDRVQSFIFVLFLNLNKFHCLDMYERKFTSDRFLKR